MKYVAGVDVGSTQSKGVILDQDQHIVARSLIDTGANVTRAADRAHALALEQSGLSPKDILYVVGTGYGRYKVTFGHTQISEISCHARGAKFIFPKTRTVLDIGGQNSKAIRVGEKGDVVDFSMNDKCAAGTGRFLAAAAYILDLPLDKIGDVSLQSHSPLRITTTCTVFVESELVAYLARGKKPEDILRGMHNAIAHRCTSLMRRVGIEEEVTFTGGVSRNIGMVQALEESLEMKVNVSPESHYIGAIGAALFALERALAGVA